jgi:hypothetical protein
MKTGGRILFTAAPPGQDGCGHINMHPKEFWEEQFMLLGHQIDKEMTELVKTNWEKIGCPKYISENLIIIK